MKDSRDPLEIVILGLSITSSWGNGHATTYRGLVRELVQRGHRVLFLEHDVPWYAENRDLPRPPYGTTKLYRDLADLDRRFRARVRSADAVILGSYVQQGEAVADWALGHARGVTAFYDIDTPVTLAKLGRGDYEYLHPRLIPCFDLYLSFTGGSILRRLEREFGAQRALALFCSCDPALYFPEDHPENRPRWDLGYLGTYSDDRQPAVESLLLEPARRLPGRRFAVAGPAYPQKIAWPANVDRFEHLAPGEHRAFYNRQRYTLNVTRADMRRAGYSPSIRLFEAAACGTPIVSDDWPGLETFFQPGREILIAATAEEVEKILRHVPEAERLRIGCRARRRVLAEHTAAQRAATLESYLIQAAGRRSTGDAAAMAAGETADAAEIAW
ncbi:MAG TPA: glycosyltransferase [Thermoanaerobaculia bacterium]|jgi:spore maturation protein CgeB|nr:glycosyltransferase [Thermoanaerobaculia bacterium]